MTKDLSRTPHKIRGTTRAWFYEEEQGICVVQDLYCSLKGYQGTRSVLIPWRAIRAALKRLEKK